MTIMSRPVAKEWDLRLSVPVPDMAALGGANDYGQGLYAPSEYAPSEVPGGGAQLLPARRRARHSLPPAQRIPRQARPTRWKMPLAYSPGRQTWRRNPRKKLGKQTRRDRAITPRPKIRSPSRKRHCVREHCTKGSCAKRHCETPPIASTPRPPSGRVCRSASSTILRTTVLRLFSLTRAD